MGDAGSTRFIAGDALRGVAATSVLVHHVAFGVAIAATGVSGAAAFEAGYGGAAGGFLRGLDLGLFIFFVLSGYLLGRPFVVALADRRPLPSLPRYALARIRRIVPAFWLVLVVVLVWHGTGGASPGELVALFGFAQVYAPSPPADYVLQGWTLGVEMAFYAALPLAALALALVTPRLTRRRARLALICLAALGVGAVSLWARLTWPETATISRAFPGSVVAFVPGLLLAAFEVALAPRLHGRRVGRAAAVGALALGGVLLLVHATAVPVADAWRDPVAIVAAGLLVAGPMVWQWSSDTAWRVLHHPVMVWLGERSYAIYLWHVLLGVAVADWLGGRFGTWGFFAVALVLVTALTLVAAELSWRLVERPALRRRGQTARKRVTTPSSSSAT